MYKFWYDYIKPKYEDRAKLCYTDTDSFIIHIITEDFLKTLLMMLQNGLINLSMMTMIKYLYDKILILIRIFRFDQCLIGFLLNLIVHLFFQILNLLLLIFCMDDLEYMANFYVFSNHLYIAKHLSF